jgi:GntR family transcriptional regulator/MocR family aminotransferase
MQQVEMRHHDHALPCTPGVPDLDNFPSAIWQKLNRHHQDRTVLMGYHNDQGYEPLRKALATYLRVSRGVNCTPEQIVITQGAQQAISLCSQILLNDQDVVLHENPGYKGASSAFLIRDPNIISVPLKNNTLDVDWITQSKEATQARLVYTCPTHQYPMGGLLSASERLALLNWSQDNNVWIIEDDYDSEFHFQHKPVAAMQGMTEHNHVLYMGSFSKTLFPSLRLGYLVLPPELVSTFTAAKSFLSGESPLLPQAVIADFIQEGHFVRHLRRMRLLYKEKWHHFDQCVSEHLGNQVTTIAESAGMHLVLEIPNINDVALRSFLNQNGFGSSALSSYYLGNAEKTGLVLGFANTTEQNRVDVVKLIGRWLTKVAQQ